MAKRKLCLPKFEAVLHSGEDEGHSLKRKLTRSDNAVAVRNFEHVAGNWPTFVCIDAHVATSIEEKARELLAASTEQQIEKVESAHLSLSKTFPLREHQIESFRRAIEKAVHGMGSFELTLSGLKLYESENKSRVFSSVLVQRGKQQFRELVERVNEVVGSFLKPLYFENPEPHISLFWAPQRIPDESEGAEEKGQTSRGENLEETETESCVVNFVRVYAGDKRFDIDLSQL